MLLLCLAYVYYCNPERRAVYRRVGLISLVPAVALLIALVPRLFASRMVDGALISPDDSRYTFFIQGLLDFVKNPLFGCGLGSMHNAPIFLGVEGSIVWYHNLIAQILGSMGLVGAVGYGWLFYDRVRLLWRKRSRMTLAFALSYFAMLLISMTNPGMLCPMPNALLMVAMFVVVERQPDTRCGAGQGRHRQCTGKEIVLMKRFQLLTTAIFLFCTLLIAGCTGRGVEAQATAAPEATPTATADIMSGIQTGDSAVNKILAGTWTLSARWTPTKKYG